MKKNKKDVKKSKTENNNVADVFDSENLLEDLEVSNFDLSNKNDGKKDKDFVVNKNNDSKISEVKDNSKQNKFKYKDYFKNFNFKCKNHFKNLNQKALELYDYAGNTSREFYDLVRKELSDARKDLDVFFYDFMQKKLDAKNQNVLSEDTKKNSHAIEIKNLYMRYTKRSNLSIKNCSFSVDYGDFHVFIGQNGAGKSTIIKMIIGLNLDYQGEIFVGGIDGRNHISRKDMVFIPDKPIFPLEFSSFDYLMEFARLHTRNSDEFLKKEIEKYLEWFEILDIANRNPNKLSSGQKQKILIIKILLLNSKIIVLDEPTSNLDTITRKQFLDILKDLTVKNKVTVFISTHVLEEIKNYANSATFIDKGEILWSGKVKNNDIVAKHNKLFGLV